MANLILQLTKETNSLVKAFLYILSAKEYKQGYSEMGKNPFLMAHKNIQEYFITYKVYPIGFLEIILPECKFGYAKLCEGRLWFEQNSEELKTNDNGEIIAFCPRKAGPCVAEDFGARIFSNPKKNWSLWSLFDLIDECQIDTSAISLRKNDIYVLKLNGWINRLLEIRKRMICSICNQTLIGNLQYAKNLAVYNSTVADCKDGHESVYLTHCWGCEAIIDSRESKHKIEGMYVCIHCGGGPKHPKSSYKPGEFCPNCASVDMEIIDRDAWCLSCDHLIKIPNKY